MPQIRTFILPTMCILSISKICCCYSVLLLSKRRKLRSVAAIAVKCIYIPAIFREIAQRQQRITPTTCYLPHRASYGTYKILVYFVTIAKKYAVKNLLAETYNLAESAFR